MSALMCERRLTRAVGRVLPGGAARPRRRAGGRLAAGQSSRTSRRPRRPSGPAPRSATRCGSGGQGHIWFGVMQGRVRVSSI